MSEKRRCESKSSMDEDAQPLLNSQSSSSEYETCSQHSTSSLSDESSLMSSNVWIIGLVPGGRIKTVEHLTNIVRSRFPTAIIETAQKDLYFGGKVEVLTVELPDVISFEDLCEEFGLWQNFMIFDVE